jgi:hypothetical protein
VEVKENFRLARIGVRGRHPVRFPQAFATQKGPNVMLTGRLGNILLDHGRPNCVSYPATGKPRAACA